MTEREDEAYGRGGKVRHHNNDDDGEDDDKSATATTMVTCSLPLCLSGHVSTPENASVPETEAAMYLPEIWSHKVAHSDICWVHVDNEHTKKHPTRYAARLCLVICK